MVAAPEKNRSSAAMSEKAGQRTLLGYFQQKSSGAKTVNAPFKGAARPSVPLTPQASSPLDGRASASAPKYTPRSRSAATKDDTPSGCPVKYAGATSLEMDIDPKTGHLSSPRRSPRKNGGLSTPTASSSPLPRDDPLPPAFEPPKIIASHSSSGRAIKRVVYDDTSSESDGEDPIASIKSAVAHRADNASKQARSAKLQALQRKKSRRDDDDFIVPDHESEEEVEDGMPMDQVSDESVNAEESEEEERPRPSKQAKKQSSNAVRRSPLSSTPPLGGTAFSALTKAEARVAREKQVKKDNQQRYKWLTDEQDAEGNRPGQPDYDPRTLKIPNGAWATFTPFEKQYWEIKCKHWDTICFFKKGKFYELYEKDADIGHQKFDLKLTDRVNMKMVGVPEAKFDVWASRFIASGFKVARVDQLETAVGKDMRGKLKGASDEKIVRRELTAVLTSGTLVDDGFLRSEDGVHCLSVKESFSNDHLPVFGLAFVDTSTASFHVAQFKDDANRIKLETVLRQLRVQEIVYEKGIISAKTMKVLRRTVSPDALWSPLKPGAEFWSNDRTKDELESARYFQNSDGPRSQRDWPKALLECLKDDLLFSALGGLVSYLRAIKLDYELLSLGNIHKYDPVQSASSLVLDGQTLANIEVLSNSQGGDEQSLLRLLNRCVTSFGKRLFRIWLCHPLREVEAINARLDAVDDLLKADRFIAHFSEAFSGYPDLERLISRVHAKSCKPRDLVQVLDRFECMKDIVDKLASEAESFSSPRVISLLHSAPDVAAAVADVKAMFNLIDDQLVPVPGASHDYDDNCTVIDGLDESFNQCLSKYKTQFANRTLCFKHSGTKEIYQIEMPANLSSKVPRDWIKLSSTKQVHRYWSPAVRDLVVEMKEARETRANILRDFFSQVCGAFDTHFKQWVSVVTVVAELDCLISLAQTSRQLGPDSCRPELVEAERAVLDFENLRHPTISTAMSSDFIPSSPQLGGSHPNVILLTGPNAAGKSTLLRSTCAAVIMAQVGCYVPATRARLTPVDRIMSRLGASDNLLQQQSTFMVEMMDTQKIIAEASPKSLVILDELGRGSSTTDGYAIAYAVLQYLSTHMHCLGFFATHYGSLCDEFANHPEIALKSMACLVDESQRRVTFQYLLVGGISAKSYGMHVASMCGIPEAVVDRAYAIASSVETAQGEKKRRLESTREQSVVSNKIGLGLCHEVEWLIAHLARCVSGSDRFELAGSDARTAAVIEKMMARV